MYFEIISEITEIELIASGHSIRELPRLIKFYGKARWRKLKGKAKIQQNNGKIQFVELHWYEANGIGKKEFKVKYILK